MLTRKYYQQIAEVIRTEAAENKQFHKEGDISIYERDEVIIRLASLVSALCQIFRADNPEFSESRFIAACGVEMDLV